MPFLNNIACHRLAAAIWWSLLALHGLIVRFVARPKHSTKQFLGARHGLIGRSAVEA